jgi:hypothetical protein
MNTHATHNSVTLGIMKGAVAKLNDTEFEVNN